MSAPALEALLARLYTDAGLRREFVDDPAGVAHREGLDERQAQRLCAIDRVGLAMAAESFSRKRAAHAGKRRSLLARLYSAVSGGGEASKTSR